MHLRTLAILPLALVMCSAFAATDPQDMNERYHDAERCMDRAMGKQWPQRYAIELATNRWGAVEPTAKSIDTAPQGIRMTDMRCRRESSIEREPRP